MDGNRLNPASPAHPHREQWSLKDRQVEGAEPHSFRTIENESRVVPSSGETTVPCLSPEGLARILGLQPHHQDTTIALLSILICMMSHSEKLALSSVQSTGSNLTLPKLSMSQMGGISYHTPTAAYVTLRSLCCH
ncbi:hypothetical protein HispidOSU_029262 [Sigmodon hispidus]